MLQLFHKTRRRCPQFFPVSLPNTSILRLPNLIHPPSMMRTLIYILRCGLPFSPGGGGGTVVVVRIGETD